MNSVLFVRCYDHRLGRQYNLAIPSWVTKNSKNGNEYLYFVALVKILMLLNVIEIKHVSV